MLENPTLGRLLEPISGGALGRELREIRAAFAGFPNRVYLVGGLVRDLLLGRDSTDIDLAVAGGLEDAAQRLGRVLETEPRHHRSFLTASVESPRGFSIDLARLRSERYPEPAALPRVEAGSLAEDLYRRDFTLNAMAVELGRDASLLIDLHDGLDDLAARRLRVLHENSFVDDPTRILRGLRLGAEIGLSFAAETRELAAALPARRALARVSGFRLWRELRYAFSSPAAADQVIRGLASLGLSSAIHPGLENLAFSPGNLGAPTGRAEFDPAGLLAAWIRPLDRNRRWELAERLALSRRERLAIGLSPLRHERRRRER